MKDFSVEKFITAFLLGEKWELGIWLVDFRSDKIPRNSAVRSVEGQRRQAATV